MERGVNINMKPIKIAFAIILVLYIIFLIKVAFFKESAVFHQHMSTYRKGYFFNIHPFKSIIAILNDNKGAWYIIQNIIGNIYLFVPIGIFLPLINKKMSYKWVIISGIIISISIETIQYIFIIGDTDIDDVILNVLGTIIGLLIFLLLKNLFTDERRLVMISLATIVVMGVLCISAIIVSRSDIFFPLKNKNTGVVITVHSHG